jgi:hypothetical protein
MFVALMLTPIALVILGLLTIESRRHCSGRSV